MTGSKGNGGSNEEHSRSCDYYCGNDSPESAQSHDLPFAGISQINPASQVTAISGMKPSLLPPLQYVNLPHFTKISLLARQAAPLPMPKTAESLGPSPSFSLETGCLTPMSPVLASLFTPNKSATPAPDEAAQSVPTSQPASPGSPAPRPTGIPTSWRGVSTSRRS